MKAQRKEDREKAASSLENNVGDRTLWVFHAQVERKGSVNVMD
jgi:hypothetical protein